MAQMSGIWAVIDAKEQELFDEQVRFFDRARIFADVGIFLKSIGHELAGNTLIENAMLLSAEFPTLEKGESDENR